MLVETVRLTIVRIQENAHASETQSQPGHLDITITMHHDVHMRTTLTLDTDIAERIQQEMRRTGKGLKAVVNEALRLGLAQKGKPARPSRFTVKPQSFGFKPGIDLDRLNQLVDELEATEAARKLQQ